MASEIRVDKINSLSGVGTVTLSPTGVDIAGITTAATLRSTTGIVTSLTAGSLTSLGAISGTTGTFTGNVAVSGANITLQDSGGASDDRLTFGAGTDLSIYHDGSNSRIVDSGTGELRIDSNSLRIRNAAGTETSAVFTEDGSVVLRYNNVTKLETTSAGIDVSGNLLLDSSSAEINLKAGTTGATGAINWTFNTEDTNYSSINVPYDTRATDGLIVDGGSYSVSLKHGSEYLGKFIADGAVELYHNNSKKFETTSSGTTVTGAETITGGGGDNLKIDMTGATSPYINFREGSTNKCFLQWDATNDDLRIYNYDSVADLRIGDGGIKFQGDTAAANALDDYEEGTWTPIFADASSGGNASSSYTHQLGWYTKIGNLVNVQGRLSGCDTTGLTGSHAFYIRNLPYAMEQSTARLMTGSALCSNINLDSDTRSIGVLANVGSSANTWFRFFQVRDNTGWAILTVSAVPDGNNEFLWNFSYRVS